MSEKGCCCGQNQVDQFTELAPVLDKYAKVPGSLITILQKAQDIYGYLSFDAINYISEATGIKPAKIYGVATFYSQFRLKPIGKYLIMLCKGTACHVNGADTIEESICEYLNMQDGETTEDRLVHPEQRSLPGMLLAGSCYDGKKCRRRRDLRQSDKGFCQGSSGRDSGKSIGGEE